MASADFVEGSHDPVGSSARIVNFRSGFVEEDYRRSFYSLDEIYVEVDVPELVNIPQSLLEVDAAQKSPEVQASYPHLDKLSVKYDELAGAAWAYWVRVARWAINEPLIGIPQNTSNDHTRLKMPRLREKSTGFSIWAATGIFRLHQPVYVDEKRWSHINLVLSHELTPPVWYDYLVEAEQRVAQRDYSGCVLSSVIACETVARACYFHLLGTPIHPTAAELVDRTAAQAIIGRWKKLTGIELDSKVHKIFDTRNRLVHSGDTDIIDYSLARETLDVAWKFVKSADKWWFDQRGRANPRAEAEGWKPAKDSVKFP